MTELEEIDMEKIKVSNSNTRKDLNAGTEDADIDALAESIKEKGLLSPIMVMKKEDNTYEIIAGQRRYLACKKLGKPTISAIIKETMDDIDATVISLIENVHRADMNPMDKARAFDSILKKFGDYEKVAKEVGLTILTIRRYMKLLDLNQELQNKVSTKEGFAGIETLSKIATTFSKEHQNIAMETLGGFNQRIQLEMIKRSNGDLNILSLLKEPALKGAFDIVTCNGLEGCPHLTPDEKEFIVKYRDYKSQNPDIEDNKEDFVTLIRKLKQF